MIRQSMPFGFDPTGGHRFSEKIMLEPKAGASRRSRRDSSQDAKRGAAGDFAS
jgi:hypothetical protein